MKIKKADMNDLKEILNIYSYARRYMKEHKNPTQWGDDRPSESVIKNDITNGNSFVVIDNDVISGVFSFIIGEDETYKKIYDGKWLNDKAYGTVHRLAGNGKSKGIFDFSMGYCEKLIDNIRIDTHKNNKIMQYLLSKRGYKKCGIILWKMDQKGLHTRKRLVRKNLCKFYLLLKNI